MSNHPKTWLLWGTGSSEKFRHVGQKHYVDLHFLDQPTVPVTAYEDPNGPYYGWIDNKRSHPTMIWHDERLFDICFANGYKHAETVSAGKMIRLNVVAGHVAANTLPPASEPTPKTHHHKP